MSTHAISTQDMSKWMEQWYNALLRHQLDEAVQWKEQVERTIMDMEEDQTLLIYYSLLILRHNLLTRDQAGLNQYAQSITPFEEQSGPLLTYYYHLFTGMYKAYEGAYNDALHHYISAEDYLKEIPDQMEKAEFHYRVASVYYHIRQTLLAFKHVKQAKALFDSDKAYVQNSADCENLLGLCYLANKDFAFAEDHLTRALNTAVTLEDEELALHIRYNFGFMYAEKGESDEAVRFLKSVNEAGFNREKASFLLAREYFKLGQAEEAFKGIEAGLEACRETENAEYSHHLAVLKALHDESADEEKEMVVAKAIDYFSDNRLYGYMNDYLGELAHYFFEQKQFEKAGIYFERARRERDRGKTFVL